MYVCKQHVFIGYILIEAVTHNRSSIGLKLNENFCLIIKFNKT